MKNSILLILLCYLCLNSYAQIIDSQPAKAKDSKGTTDKLLESFKTDKEKAKSFSLTFEDVKMLRALTNEWISTYCKYLNLLAKTSVNSNDKMLLVSNMLPLFEDDAVKIVNDIDLSGNTGGMLRAGHYLSLAACWFGSPGAEIKFDNLNLSNGYVDKEHGYIFFKADYNRVLSGADTKGKALSSNGKIDIFIKYQIKGDKLIKKPCIYSINGHDDDISTFERVETEDVPGLKVTDNGDMESIMSNLKKLEEFIINQK